MSANLIISYDGTENDDDALALGKLLPTDGSKLELAYVRHAPEYDVGREALAQHDAERRLEFGALRLGDPGILRYVVFSGCTRAGLEELAEAEGASIIVFGSDYRTPSGHAEPPTSAQRILEIGAIGIAVAATGLRAVREPSTEPREASSIVRVAATAGRTAKPRCREMTMSVARLTDGERCR
jgi:hypothetical protein